MKTIRLPILLLAFNFSFGQVSTANDVQKQTTTTKNAIDKANEKKSCGSVAKAKTHCATKEYDADAYNYTKSNLQTKSCDRENKNTNHNHKKKSCCSDKNVAHQNQSCSSEKADKKSCCKSKEQKS